MSNCEGGNLREVVQKDSRVACKYGSKCYQKNPAHFEKYKHVSVKHDSPSVSSAESTAKKFKYSRSPESGIKDGSVQDLEHSGEELYQIQSTEIPGVIKELFLVDMPDDFYSFWSFCNSLNEADPSGAFKEVNLSLVGPFDLIKKQERYINCKKSDVLRHWRFYFDPPEFQTIIKGDDRTEYHMGYYRDDPDVLPCFVACNSSAENSIIEPMAENIFGAVNSYLETRMSKSNPFQRMKINSLQKSLQLWAKNKGYNLNTDSPTMRSRNKKVVAKTFHKAGIVVPVNKKTDIGYRPLIEEEGKLKQILRSYAVSTSEGERKSVMNILQPIITAADIANDECDFGTSLELGLDLFSFGGEVFHGMIKHLLCTAYSLLNRNEFSDIIKKIYSL